MSTRAPNCDADGKTVEERTHTQPDANQLCGKCKRWIVSRACWQCEKTFYRLKYDRDKWLCPECSEEAGL